jgi:hypothetical protein
VVDGVKAPRTRQVEKVNTVSKILTLNGVLCIVFVIAGVILYVTHNGAAGQGAFGTATGLAIGSGTATVIVNANAKNGTTTPPPTSTATDPTPPPKG